MFESKVVKNAISKDMLQKLKQDFLSNTDVHWEGRRFNTNIEFAKELLIPVITPYLQGSWVIDGGNYFETTVPYRLHCDSGKGLSNLWYNIVIPLEFTSTEYNAEYNKLIVTNQTWNGDAAFFVKGAKTDNEYNASITDYSNVGNLATGIDSKLKSLCTHLPLQQLDGFTIKSIIDWEPGDIILFKRNLIHVTSNWHKAGVTKKLGLSFFTSYLEPGSV